MRIAEMKREAGRLLLLRAGESRQPSAVAGRYWQATPFTANAVGAALTVLFQVPLNPVPE
jgi:hypothetical protein